MNICEKIKKLNTKIPVIALTLLFVIAGLGVVVYFMHIRQDRLLFDAQLSAMSEVQFVFDACRHQPGHEFYSHAECVRVKYLQGKV